MSAEPSLRARSLRRTMIREVFDAAPPGAINLGLGQPDLVTPPGISLAGVGAISGGRTGYTTTAGLPELRELVAARYPGHAEGPDEALITVGSQEAMVVACFVLTDPGDEVLYPDPGYPAYPVVAGLVGAAPRPYPLRPEREFRLSADDVIQRIGPRTRAVILCAPSNPTGAYHPADELTRLLRELRSREIAWLSDEIYEGFRWRPGFVSPTDISPRHGLVVAGLSKDACMTGWRVGWIAGPERLVRRATALHQYLVTCAPSPSQHAAVAALSAGGRSARAEIVERFRERRARTERGLADVPGVVAEAPDGAFYFFVDVRAHGESAPLARRILERQAVITVPGEAFGEGGRGFLRVSFAAGEAAIDEGLRRIAVELRR